MSAAVEWNPPVSLLGRTGRVAAQSARGGRLARIGAALAVAARACGRYVLDVVGLGLIAASGYAVNLALGLALSGVAALILQWRITG